MELKNANYGCIRKMNEDEAAGFIRIGDKLLLSNDRMLMFGDNGEVIMDVENGKATINNNNYGFRVTPHAKWEQSNVSSRQVRCSHCKGSVHFWHGKREWDWKFCKDCGAVMDLEE